MKCTIKGCSAWSDVAATRQRANHVTVRTRRCANGHLFSTLEKPEVKQKRIAQRNRQIIAAVKAGMSLSEAGRRWGLSGHAQVSRIVHAALEAFDARGQGQRTRWEKKRAGGPDSGLAAATLREPDPAVEPA